MCWCLIWQNLPHIWGRFCHLRGHILSVVGHFSISPDVNRKIPRGQEERFIHHHHQLYNTKWQPYMVPVTDFLSCLCTGAYFKGLSLGKRSWRTLIASGLHNHLQWFCISDMTRNHKRGWWQSLSQTGWQNLPHRTKISIFHFFQKNWGPWLQIAQHDSLDICDYLKLRQKILSAYLNSHNTTSENLDFCNKKKSNSNKFGHRYANFL